MLPQTAGKSHSIEEISNGYGKKRTLRRNLRWSPFRENSSTYTNQRSNILGTANEGIANKRPQATSQPRNCSEYLELPCREAKVRSRRPDFGLLKTIRFIENDANPKERCQNQETWLRATVLDLRTYLGFGAESNTFWGIRFVASARYSANPNATGTSVNKERRPL